MKINLKRSFSVLLAALMLISVFAGCSSDGGKTSGAASQAQSGNAESGSTAVDTSQEVNLKMYLLGDVPADFDTVYEKINEEMKSKINATVDVSFLSWAEHDEKYSLLFSSGEDFDIIFTASGWAHYEPTAQKKGFYDMTEEFRNTYAPDIMEVLPEEAWEQAKINGNVYMVPNYSVEFGADAVAVRGDLMEKFGISDITSQADYENYLQQVMENETGITPFGSQGMALQYLYLIYGNHWNFVKGAPLPLFTYDYLNTESNKIISVAESDEFRAFAKQMKEMADAGYWSKDALSTTDTRNDAFVQGRAASMVWNVGSLQNYCEQVNKEHPDWKATIYDITPDMPRTVNPYTNNGVAINAMSNHPERAMMAINQFMTNKVIYDLAAYGVEGVHYNAKGDNQYTTAESAERFPAGSACNWGWNNENLKRTLYQETPDAARVKGDEIIASWKTLEPEVHPLSLLTFDEANVKTEIAVISTLITQYMDPISTGFVDDSDKAVDEFVSKLKEAGIDKVMAEIEAQRDAALSK